MQKLWLTTLFPVLATLGCAPPTPPPDHGDVHDCGFQDRIGTGDQLLGFSSEDEVHDVLLVRHTEGFGGFYYPFELKFFALAIGEELSCIEEQAALSYEDSHHNWTDAAHAAIDGRTWTVDLRFQPEGDPVTSEWVWTYTLTAHEGDDVVVGPLELTVTEGDPEQGPQP